MNIFDTWWKREERIEEAEDTVGNSPEDEHRRSLSARNPREALSVRTRW